MLNLILRQLAGLAGTPGVTQVLTDTTGTSQRTTALRKHALYLLCSNGPFHLALGGDTVTATTSNQYWPANYPLALYTGEHSYLAIIRASGVSTTVTVTEWSVDPEPLTSPFSGQYGA